MEKGYKNYWSSLCFLLFLHSTFVITAIFTISHAENWIPEAWDSVTGHIPLINYFIHHPFHLFSYPSMVSTLPGYHLFLAMICYLFGISHLENNSWSIRMMNILIGDGLLIVVWNIIWLLQGSIKTTFVLLMPIAFSYYVLSAAIWINTDNFALLFYAILIFIFLFNGSTWLAMLTSFLMVMTRQLYLPVVLAFWPPGIFPRFNSRLLKLATSITLFSTLIILMFAWQWKGLTPINTQQLNKFVGINLSGLLHAFALSGFLSIPYLPLFFAKHLQYQKKHMGLIALATILTTILWTLGKSTYDYAAGRGGSVIWRIAAVTPSYRGHSFIIFFLDWIGIFIFMNMIRDAVIKRYYPIEVMMLLCYFFSCSAQILCFQRYIEVPILITYGIFCARTVNSSSLSLLGPLTLSAVFFLADFCRFWIRIIQ